MPILGGWGITPATTLGEMDACLPEPAGRRTQGQMKRQTELGTLRQLHGGWAGGQAGSLGKESLELGKRRGLLQGLLQG